MNRYLVNQNESLLTALAKLNALEGNEMTLFVHNDEGQIVGTLTDGDIRRGLLAGITTDSPVATVTHCAFKFLKDGDLDIFKIRDCRDKGICMIPVLDDDGRLRKVVNLNRTHTVLPISAILMAGGQGERLRPMTLTTPKPLLEIDGKAIIDYNIEALAACGIDDITVCTRYLSEKIFEHFDEPVCSVKVKCIREDEPLGTLGAASLVEHKVEANTLIMNSDLLTTISFEELYLRHVSENADITVAVIPYQVSVPYAILTTSGSEVCGIEEKPSYSYYANAGIYLFTNKMLSQLNVGQRIDATDFISDAIAQGRRVTFYPINGTWIDVGSPTDFRQATEIVRHHRNMSKS